MTERASTTGRGRQAVVFTIFALLPGLAYQWIQDEGRSHLGGTPLTDYLFGVAPNALGGLSLTVGLAVIAEGRVGKTAVALFSLAGLWAWEVAQVWLPGGTFDLHDLAWTVPGIALAWIIIRLLLAPKKTLPTA